MARPNHSNPVGFMHLITNRQTNQMNGGSGAMTQVEVYRNLHKLAVCRAVCKAQWREC
jgi:hypothetical protein